MQVLFEGKPSLASAWIAGRQPFERALQRHAVTAEREAELGEELTLTAERQSQSRS
jgi:hypothetical protein